MKIGTVTEKVNIKRRAEQMEEAQILLVELEGNGVAALDLAGAKPGDRVLVALGHAASRYSMDTPSDAVITGVVRPEE